MSNSDDENSNLPPPALGALQSLASGYGEYMAYLKQGGESGISGVFGKVSLEESSRRLEALSQRLGELSQRLPTLDTTMVSAPDSDLEQDSLGSGKKARAKFTVEDMMGAVFAILSSSLTVEQVCLTYGAEEEQVRVWVDLACKSIEISLRALDDSI
jgi:hypothetical protein